MLIGYGIDTPVQANALYHPVRQVMPGKRSPDRVTEQIAESLRGIRRRQQGVREMIHACSGTRWTLGMLRCCCAPSVSTRLPATRLHASIQLRIRITPVNRLADRRSRACDQRQRYKGPESLHVCVSRL